jgi:hypothetical protein
MKGAFYEKESCIIPSAISLSTFSGLRFGEQSQFNRYNGRDFDGGRLEFDRHLDRRHNQRTVFRFLSIIRSLFSKGLCFPYRFTKEKDSL